MKRIALATLIAASTFTVVGGSPAQASAACATGAEYLRVHNGQTVTRVRQIFGGREGWVYDYGDHRERIWHKCNAGERYAAISFRNGVVIRKEWTS